MERHWRIGGIVAAVLLVEALDLTILHIAVPTIASAFHLPVGALDLALLAFPVGLALSLPLGGWSASRYGSRSVFICSLCLFLVGSLICSAATSTLTLSAGRLVQGLGSGLTGPVGRAAFLAVCPRRHLLRVSSLLALPLLIGTACGPILGGLLAEHTSWRYIFLINVPLILPLLIVSFLTFDSTRSHRHWPFDAMGFVLIGTTLLVMLGVSMSLTSTYSWMPHASVLVPVSLGAMVVSIRWIRLHQMPILSLTPLTDPSFCMTLISSTLLRLGIASLPLCLSLYLQMGKGMPPGDAGLHMVWFAIGMACARLGLILLAKRVGQKSIVAMSSGVLALILVCLGETAESLPIFGIAIYTFMVGGLVSILFGIFHVSAYETLQPRELAQASCLASFFQHLSAVFSIAFWFGGMTVMLRGHTPALVFHLLFDGMAIAVLLAGIVATTLPYVCERVRQPKQTSGREMPKSTIFSPTTVPPMRV